MNSGVSPNRGQMATSRQPRLDLSAKRALGNKFSPQTAWFLIVDKATSALELDPQKSQQLVEQMNLLDQPDDPMELHDLEDLREVIVGMEPVKGINLFHYANPEISLPSLQEAKPLEILKAVVKIFQSDRWAMQQ